MEIQLRLVVHKGKSIYDDLFVSASHVAKYKKEIANAKGESYQSKFCEGSKRMIAFAPAFLNNRKINSYAVSAYTYTLSHSDIYREYALRHLLHISNSRVPAGSCPVILIRLRTPQKQFLDYKWGERIAYMVLERCEVEHAMSWLSTLGGAFSALGEHHQHCAEMAGKISIHQFKLALRLGDPLLEARCRLYAALSIIQQGNLRIPKLMIQDIYKFAINQKDTHLQKMCQGVWAKLKYCYKLRRQDKKLRN